VPQVPHVPDGLGKPSAIAAAERHQSNVRWARDGENLLPGEDPTTNEVEEARHWTLVYQELLKFNRQLAERLQEGLTSRPEPLEQEDVELLTAHMKRMEERLAFWQSRRWHMAEDRKTG
jgi:hypothetical protein